MQDQLELFEKNEYSINKPIRLLETFSGMGTQSQALERLGVDFEHYFSCEFDKYANAVYNAIHGTNFFTSDIREITCVDLNIVDTDKYCYLLTYSFPCTDLSVAGKQAGMSRNSGTRSGLLWEVERLLKECKQLSEKDNKYGLPQVLLMENVTQVHSAKNMPDFQEWINFLTSIGYTSFYQDINAKTMGIPQNRDRTFMISLLSDDFDYVFPDEIPLEYVMADMLEDEVDEKYFLNNEKADNLIQQLIETKKIPELN